MTRLYRVLRKAYARASFDGEGAYRYGGRWSSLGVRLSYTSEHQSLAMLEYFVHLDEDDPPADLVLAVAEAANDITREHVEISNLPANWRASPAPSELARLGDEFAQRREHCLLFVSSVLAPHERNCLINPQHPDFNKLIIGPVERLSYDHRMFRERKPRRKRRKGH